MVAVKEAEAEEEEEEEEEEAKAEQKEKQTLDSILGKWSKGRNREQGLMRLAGLLKELDCKSRLTPAPEVGVICWRTETSSTRPSLTEAKMQLTTAEGSATFQLTFAQRTQNDYGME
jgi:hypothetical protein